ncbi:MAG: hypothetical protein K2L01_04355 [Rikenellaceae bacterium]|nr:hypothetical protein [Rikenellaceae bacterium]
MAKKERKATSGYNDASQSGRVYREALQEYKDNIERSRTNPLLDIAESAAALPDTAEYARRRDRKAQAATVNALGELASVIGGGIAAAWGGNPPLPDKVSARLAEARIADMDEDMRDEFDAYRKTNLAEAVRRDKSMERATENYLDHLYRINRDDKRARDTAALQRERAAATEKITRERIEAAQKSAAGKASPATARKTQNEKPVTYILDDDNKRVAVYRDEMTQLYELADNMGILDKYRSAGNNDERREALYVAISRAYKEKQKLLKQKRDDK